MTDQVGRVNRPVGNRRGPSRRHEQVANAGRLGRLDLKVLFITDYAKNVVLAGGHLDAGMHILTKPFAMETLANQIKELLSA